MVGKTLMGTLLCLVIVASARAETKVAFDDKGLSSIQVNGVEKLVGGTPKIWRIRSESGKELSNKVIDLSFDPASKTLTQKFDWGSVVVAYEPLPQGVRLSTTVTNSGTETIDEVGVAMATVADLGEGSRIGHAAFGVEGPGLVTAGGADGAIVWASESSDKPLTIDLSKGQDSRTKAPLISARAMMGGGRIILHDVTAARPIKPGESEAFTVALRLGPAGADPIELAGDFIDAYRKAHPMELQWPDRRPILRLFFGGGLPKDQANANLKNPDAVQPPAPDPKFQAQLLNRMRDTVKAAKASNAQGVILWDPEGGTYPHAITYIGDPRMIRLLNPQMDLVLDEAVKILQDGGLKVGMTLRPPILAYSEQKDSATQGHSTHPDPLANLDAKIKYVRDRWNLRIIYVDTNFYWKPYGPEKKWQSGQLPPQLWKTLQEKYPDTLFIPEFGSPLDYAYTAPYGEADMGNYATPGLVRAIWPESFRVLVIEDADPYDNYERFVRAVMDRNCLMTYAFSPTAFNLVAMTRIYREADLRKAPPPAGVANADAAKLVEMLKDPAVITRFAAANQLRENPDASAAAALLASATDEKEDWLVRRASLRALAKTPNPPGIEAMIGLRADRNLGLYGAAGDVLTGAGPGAIEPILARIESQATSAEGDPKAIEQLGDVLVALKAKEQAPRIAEAIAKVPESARNAIQRKRALIDIAGKLGNEQVAPALIQTLNNPALRKDSAAALVRLHSAPGIARVKAMLEDAKKSNDAATVDALNQALRAK